MQGSCSNAICAGMHQRKDEKPHAELCSRGARPLLLGILLYPCRLSTCEKKLRFFEYVTKSRVDLHWRKRRFGRPWASAEQRSGRRRQSTCQFLGGARHDPPRSSPVPNIKKIVRADLPVCCQLTRFALDTPYIRCWPTLPQFGSNDFARAS